MANRALPGDFEVAHGENGNAPPVIDVAAYGQELFRASDGDGAMLGRVLIYASIITVVVALIIWKQLS
jgi:hypothetical protein